MTRTSTVISKVAFLGDYLPRKCGIAMSDFATSFATVSLDSLLAAMEQAV